MVGNYLADIYGLFYLQVGTTLITAGTIFSVLGVSVPVVLILIR